MNFDKLGGLVPAVVQHHATGEVLMVGFMTADALALTERTGFATFYSRSRQRLWTKGETSGNRLAVRRLLVDCDDDAVLLQVEPLGTGAVCHTGRRSCFVERPSAPAPSTGDARVEGSPEPVCPEEART